jgi:hypothetical protein
VKYPIFWIIGKLEIRQIDWEATKNQILFEICTIWAARLQFGDHGTFSTFGHGCVMMACLTKQKLISLPEHFEPQVSQCNKYALDTILVYISMGIKVNFQCYLVARFWSQRSDPCYLITEILDNNQHCLHFFKAKFSLACTVYTPYLFYLYLPTCLSYWSWFMRVLHISP